MRRRGVGRTSLPKRECNGALSLGSEAVLRCRASAEAGAEYSYKRAVTKMLRTCDSGANAARHPSPRFALSDVALRQYDGWPSVIALQVGVAVWFAR